jgi:hypothetical protein
MKENEKEISKNSILLFFLIPENPGTNSDVNVTNQRIPFN